jgi:uncharacterized protein (TIGR02271 family)
MKDHARRRPDPRRVDETRIQPVEPGPPVEPRAPRQRPARAGRVDRVSRVEERLVPEKQVVRAGAVRVRRRTVEEPASVEVDVRNDRLSLERRPADRALEPGEQPVTERGDVTVVLVVEERLEVRKVPWVVEEIHLRREVVTETVTVSDTVRRQHVEIAPEGDIQLSTNDS